MKKATYSAIIPTCDRPDLILQAIQSVLNQSRAADEIIIVDNGRAQLSLPEAVADKVNLIRGLPRFGVSQARNLGAIFSSSDYIAFLDDDDAWDKDYLKSVDEALRVSDAQVVLGRLRDMKTKAPTPGKHEAFTNEMDLKRRILLKNPGAGGSNTVVARSAFFHTAGYDPYLTTNQDKALVLDMMLIGSKVIRAHNAWVDFRDDAGVERQTDLKKRIKGKIRFTLKYASIMSFSALVFNLAQVVRLAVKSKL